MSLWAKLVLYFYAVNSVGIMSLLYTWHLPTANGKQQILDSKFAGSKSLTANDSSNFFHNFPVLTCIFSKKFKKTLNFFNFDPKFGF